jgi:hypothetical protein
MDQAASRGWPAENEPPHMQTSLARRVANVVLQVGIFGLGDLTLRVVYNVHATIVRWAENQPDTPSSEAIRRLVEIGLKTKK